MKRAWLVVVVFGLTLLACPGLLTAPGNDFPCDFSKPPGARDAVCSTGDVCGVNNRCQRFQYEGPQFEGKPTFPDFSDGGARLHPMQLSAPIEAIAAIHPILRVQLPPAVVVQSGGATFRIDQQGVRPVTFPKPLSSLSDLTIWQLGNGGLIAVGREETGSVYYQGGGPGDRVRDGAQMLSAARLRVLNDETGADQLAAITMGQAGLIRHLPPPPDFERFSSRSDMIDLAAGPSLPGRATSVVLLTTAGFSTRVDGGVESLAAASFPSSSLLSADPKVNVYAVLSAGAGKVLLSTWEVVRSARTFEVTPAWSDCAPCTANRRQPGGSLPVTFSAGSDLGGPFVDVLCRQLEADGGLELRRIRGASSSGGPCLEEERAAPFSLDALARDSRAGLDVIREDVADSSRFLAGGTHGEVWRGPSVGDAFSLFLDRVPVDVAEVEEGDRKGLLALTTGGAFFRNHDPSRARTTNGFVNVDTTDNSGAQLAAIVHESGGWTLDRNGRMVRVSSGADQSVTSTPGPRLVDGRGEGVTRPLRGEAVTSLDGGLVSMLVAADDSLYFVTSAASTTTADLSPVLTPEPSTLLRGLALERTLLATDGITRVRGYMLTSRNVYEFKLGGAPLRWSTRQLLLPGADPIEVWFDNPRGGLARVGYRDGTIFTIPGGFQLTEPLPAVDTGVPVEVIDYENLGGWPVAFTSVGIFVARYDETAAGGLDSRFPDGGLNRPMTWREVRLPDGSRPWLSSARGRLHVIAEPQTGTDRAYRRNFRLLVFLPHQVLELGRHERTNISRPVE